MIDWIRWELKWYLSKLAIYRKYKGGKWYKVVPTYGGFYDSYWINRKPSFNENIITTERW